MTLRFEGEVLRIGVVAVVVGAGARTVVCLVSALGGAAAGLDEGGWFSASEDWGDWEGEMAAWAANLEGVMRADRGVVGWWGRRSVDDGGGAGRAFSVLAGVTAAGAGI